MKTFNKFIEDKKLNEAGFLGRIFGRDEVLNRAKKVGLDVSLLPMLKSHFGMDENYLKGMQPFEALAFNVYYSPKYAAPKPLDKDEHIGALKDFETRFIKFIFDNHKEKIKPFNVWGIMNAIKSLPSNRNTKTYQEAINSAENVWWILRRNIPNFEFDKDNYTKSQLIEKYLQQLNNGNTSS